MRRILFLLTLLLGYTTVTARPSSKNGNTQTYYEALELETDADKTAIKKAYRRLALQYHPDKNPDPNAVEQFRTVSEAYEVLSDPDQKSAYDRALRNGGGGGGSGYGGGGGGSNAGRANEWQKRWERNRSNSNARRDPFAQFNDLFQNDPFFKEAAEGLDDLFSRTFQQHNAQHNDRSNDRSGSRNSRRTNKATHKPNPNPPKKGWGSWIADKLGVDVQMTTSTVDRHGHRSTSSFSQQSSSRRSMSSSSSSSSSYTSKSTRTVMENGRRVTIQSMERDGNKIEEKYVGTTLVGRSINGVPEPVGRIDL